jgi:hypothetical protein
LGGKKHEVGEGRMEGERNIISLFHLLRGCGSIFVTILQRISETKKTRSKKARKEGTRGRGGGEGEREKRRRRRRRREK